MVLSIFVGTYKNKAVILVNLSNSEIEAMIENIKVLCARHNPPMKMKDFYNKSGISSSLLSQWNTGKVKPTTQRLVQAADALDVPVETLIGKEIDTEKAPRHSGATVEDIKAAFWGGDKDLTAEDLDEMFDDVCSYVAYATQRYKQRKKNNG